MTFAIISFTEHGNCLAVQMMEKLRHKDALYSFDYYDGKKKRADCTMQQWLAIHFTEKNPILFVSACGIAVRLITPFIQDKLTDSPVLVLDEKGQYVIPLLSGHVGGANELSILLAELLQAQAVITTATDLQQQFAIDLFAKQNGLSIENKEGIAKVSAKVLAGEPLLLKIEPALLTQYGDKKQGIRIGAYAWQIPQCMTKVSQADAALVDVYIGYREQTVVQAMLYLRPQRYVIGMGCRKGKTVEELTTFAQEQLHRLGLSFLDVQAVVSVDVKKKEQGLLQMTNRLRIPFVTYDKEALMQVAGNFHASCFVQKQVGVDNVCERAAMAYCGEKGSLVLPKTARDGMTIAIGRL